MRYGKSIIPVALLLVIAGCDDDGVSVNPPEPSALVRVVNVNVDTGTVDFRFIDRVENLPTLLGVPFASSSGMYQPVAPGSRPLRVFPYSNDIDVTRVMLYDGQVTLEVDRRYTFIYAGRASTGDDELVVLEDPEPPTPPDGQIALKALHGAFGTGPVDVYIVPVESESDPTPDDFATSNAGVIRNVGYLQQSSYVNVPALTGTALYRFVVAATGSTAELFASTPNRPGIPTPEGQIYGAQPGVRVAGSVLTVILAPGTIPGTRGSTPANQAPSLFVVPDKPLDP